MANVVIPYRFRVKRDTAANWVSNNPTLLEGEIGLETDTGLRKMGDGTTAWNSLLYDGIGAIDLAGRADGDTLVWNNSAGKWEPGAGGGGGAWSMVKKPLTTDRASTTTFADDPDLVITLGIGRHFVRGIQVIRLGAQAAGYKYQFNFTGVTSYVQSFRNNYSTAGGTSGTDNEFALSTNALPSGSSSGNSVPHLRTYVDMVLNVTTGGVLSLQWAQVSSSASATQLLFGSHLEYMQA